MDKSVTTRFAPSPTGRLHLGHAWSAIRAHDLARARGGRFLLRIEDIDGTRSRPEHVAAIFEDLRWLGLAWDGEVAFQSQRLGLYAAALERLRALGLVYRCFCTRAEIAASASAPHGEEGPVYPGTCRRLSDAEARAGEPHCWRLDMRAALAFVAPGSTRSPGAEGVANATGVGGANVSPWMPDRARLDEGLVWHDATAGAIVADPLPAGDVVLARKDAPSSYHLAVTVDDAAQGVTDVVRGTDLFAATHVHRLLQALLALPTPRYHHHPLLVGPDGTRLAKRHGAPALAAMRLAGEDGRTLADALRSGEVPLGFTLAAR